jgi:hypothetical protein
MAASPKGGNAMASFADELNALIAKHHGTLQHLQHEAKIGLQTRSKNGPGVGDTEAANLLGEVYSPDGGQLGVLGSKQ